MLTVTEDSVPSSTPLPHSTEMCFSTPQNSRNMQLNISLLAHWHKVCVYFIEVAFHFAIVNN